MPLNITGQTRGGLEVQVEKFPDADMQKQLSPYRSEARYPVTNFQGKRSSGGVGPTMQQSVHADHIDDVITTGSGNGGLPSSHGAGMKHPRGVHTEAVVARACVEKNTGYAVLFKAVIFQ